MDETEHTSRTKGAAGLSEALQHVGHDPIYIATAFVTVPGNPDVILGSPHENLAADPIAGEGMTRFFQEGA